MPSGGGGGRKVYSPPPLARQCNVRHRILDEPRLAKNVQPPIPPLLSFHSKWGQIWEHVSSQIHLKSPSRCPVKMFSGNHSAIVRFLKQRSDQNVVHPHPNEISHYCLDSQIKPTQHSTPTDKLTFIRTNRHAQTTQQHHSTQSPTLT